MDTVKVEREAEVWVVTLDRPDARNAVDGPTARALVAAFEAFEADPVSRVAVLAGAGGHFCAGADLKTVAGDGDEPLALNEDLARPGPMGPTRMRLSKPVVAAVAGYCVAGGLELALWCDLRVADDTAMFGVFCRRWGVPLIDGGTVRLPRVVGQGRALDMILTGRPVDAGEALAFGLANRLVPAGEARAEAVRLAAEIARFPGLCMRADRASALAQWQLPLEEALRAEALGGVAPLRAGAREGAARFAGGLGRSGNFDEL